MATIPLGLYLWRRIRDVGVETIMGVPGDFNLELLDFIYEVPDLLFVGNSNELNGAYAADGYARVHGTPGCLVTTHGVGELSALNGVAGSMAEHIPVIHVVGQTPRSRQENNVMLHHSMGAVPDHQVYKKASQGMRCAAAELWDPEKAPAEIDRVLRECVIQSLPVYIFMPSDLIHQEVSTSLLDKKIDFSLPINEANEKAAVEATVEALKTAKTPSVFADWLAHRHGLEESRILVNRLQWPTYNSHMGKTVINEDHPCYAGSYNGKISFPGVAKTLESGDLLLGLGWFPADTNTGGFTRDIKEDKLIAVFADHVIVKGKKFDNVYMAPFLTKVTAALDGVSLAHVQIPPVAKRLPTKKEETKKLIQAELWYRLGEFLRPGDIIIGETGTSSFGLQDIILPRDTHYYCQVYFGSIGMATPASMGSALALRDLVRDRKRVDGRVILFTGDGSLQLTIQEIGTMIRLGLKVIIVIINNSGYTIERAIHGARQGYNDINPTSYSHLLPLFFHPNPTKSYHSARTEDELEAALKDNSLIEPQDLQILEVHTDPLDIPWRLAGVLAAMGLEQHIRSEGFTNCDEALDQINCKWPAGYVNGSPKSGSPRSGSPNTVPVIKAHEVSKRLDGASVEGIA